MEEVEEQQEEAGCAWVVEGRRRGHNSTHRDSKSF